MSPVLIAATAWLTAMGTGTAGLLAVRHLIGDPK